LIEMDFHPEVRAALDSKKPVVALESSVISQGLPFPVNFETATKLEEIIRAENAVPATLGIFEGRVIVGCSKDQIHRLAIDKQILKASSRDLGLILCKKSSAATTVASSIVICKHAGIKVFATGGIGGVHPLPPNGYPDISADIIELSRNPVLVVTAGAKSILDLAGTLEALETSAVPLVGYKTSKFPAFYVRETNLSLPQINTPHEIAEMCKSHWSWSSSSVVACNPIDSSFGLELQQWEGWLKEANSAASLNGIHGKELTPYLLQKVSDLSNKRTLVANVELLKGNAKLAAQIASFI